jgi:uncharacterized RDD family membrane protein YckC
MINFGFTGLLATASDQVLLAASLVISAVYHITSLAVKSATPGKTAMGISVTSLDGRALTPDTAILRYVAYLISILSLVGLAVSVYMLFLDPQKRTLHDRVAKTLVIVGRPVDRPTYDRERFPRL